MALETTENRISYSGNGATTAFSFPYKFFASADLVVVLVSSAGVETVQTISTHYSVSGAGDDSGGSVTMVTAPAVGETLVIYRDPDITQGVDLRENDSLPAESVEDALDLAAMVSQRLSEQVTRAVTLSEGFVGSFDPTLPTDIDTADKVVIVNPAGNGFAMGPTADEIAGAQASSVAAAASATNAAASEAAAASSASAASTSATNAAASEAALDLILEQARAVRVVRSRYGHLIMNQPINDYIQAPLQPSGGLVTGPIILLACGIRLLTEFTGGAVTSFKVSLGSTTGGVADDLCPALEIYQAPSDQTFVHSSPGKLLVGVLPEFQSYLRYDITGGDSTTLTAGQLEVFHVFAALGDSTILQDID